MQLQRRWRLDLCPWNLCGSAGFSSPSRRLWGPALQSCDEFEVYIVYTFQLSLKDLALLGSLIGRSDFSLGACKASLGPQDGGSKFVQQERPRFLTFPLLKLQLVPEFICQDQNRQEQEEAAWHRGSRQKGGSNSCTSCEYGMGQHSLSMRLSTPMRMKCMFGEKSLFKVYWHALTTTMRCYLFLAPSSRSQSLEAAQDKSASPSEFWTSFLAPILRFSYPRAFTGHHRVWFSFGSVHMSKDCGVRQRKHKNAARVSSLMFYP